jgi:hypothetical protein
MTNLTQRIYGISSPGFKEPELPKETRYLKPGEIPLRIGGLPYNSVGC